MARDPETEALLRDALLARLPRGTRLEEKRMFGALCFMRDGNMVAGASDAGLMLRVGAGAMAEALDLPGTGPMQMAGRTVSGYLRADETAFADDDTLARLIDLAVAFTATLPAK